MVDEQVLSAAQKALGTRTYSETVNQALAQAIRGAHVQGMLNLIGKDVWSGNLGEMRGDMVINATPSAKARRKKRVL